MIAGLMKKRFIAGKIGLADLVTTEEGRERFRNSVTSPTVVYDEDTKDVKNLGSSASISLVLTALATMGRDMFVLQGMIIIIIHNRRGTVGSILYYILHV